MQPDTGETQYVNEDGSRWRIPGYRVHVYDGDVDLGSRAVDVIEAFGNFGALHYRVKGKRYASLADSFPGNDGLPIVHLDTARKVSA